MNFKKALSASIASLTMLSTLSGSISTKIYALKSGAQENVENDIQKNFIACSYNGYNFMFQYDELLQDKSNKEIVDQFIEKFKEIMANNPLDKTVPKNKMVIHEFENIPNTYGIMREFLSIANPEEQKNYIIHYLKCVLGMFEKKQQAIKACHTPVESDFHQEIPELTEPSENAKEESISKANIKTEPEESNDEEIGNNQTSTIEFLYNGYLYLIVTDKIPFNSPEEKSMDTFFRLENDIINEYYNEGVIPPTKGFVFHVFETNSDKEFMQILSSNQSDEAKKLAIKNFLNEIGAEAEKRNFEITDEKLIQKLKKQGINDINENFKTEEKELRARIEEEKIKEAQGEVVARANTPVEGSSDQEMYASSEPSENIEENKLESDEKTDVEEHKATEENQKPQATASVENQSKNSQNKDKNNKPSLNNSGKETKTEEKESQPKKSFWSTILNFLEKLPLIGKFVHFLCK